MKIYTFYSISDKDYSTVSVLNGDNDELSPTEKTRADIEATEKEKCADDVPHTPAGPQGDLYAVPVRRRQQKNQSPPASASPILPPGWEKHEGMTNS